MFKNTRELINLMNDSYAKRVDVFASEKAAKYSDEAIRKAFFEILGEDKLTWQNWRNHKNEIFTIIENVLNTNLPLAWEDSQFYNQFVESKNGLLGDTNEFVVEDYSTLIACSFSGNHWDTDRKKVGGRKAFSLPTQWIYVHVYDDFERFLKGLNSFAEFVIAMQKAMNKRIDQLVYGAFAAGGNYLPTDFRVTGSYDRTKMLELIQRVATASGQNVVIAGTKIALSALVSATPAALLSEQQKQEIATSGQLLNLTSLGVMGVEIPQTFIKGTFQFALPQNIIYVLPANEKFIKVWFEGDTRARDLTEIQTHDQTMDSQIQTKVGVGVVFSSVFGIYTVQ
jgi:hypothetical protein